jgi:NAD(P)-dependent dehydrogenase (short-subunit alcohol dehydrogenase family)
MPDMSGKTVVITGANSGIGFETARALAQKGAQVVMTARDAAKGQAALDTLRAERPRGSLELLTLDLASLASVRAFANDFTRRYTKLDILVNNAGVMHIPYRQTADGFEMQFGTNHLGHFALTGLLLPLISQTPRARVVTVSSVLHKGGHVNFDDLNMHQAYDRNKAYSQSKLANLLFAYELQRQFEAHRVDAVSLAAHPGYSATNLQYVGPQMRQSSLEMRITALMNRFIAQSAAMGALPTLYAATAPGVRGGQYIGPDGFMESRGYPTVAKSNAESYDRAVAERLWKVSEELTGVHYVFTLAANHTPVS